MNNFRGPFPTIESIKRIIVRGNPNVALPVLIETEDRIVFKSILLRINGLRLQASQLLNGVGFGEPVKPLRSAGPPLAGAVPMEMGRTPKTDVSGGRDVQPKMVHESATPERLDNSWVSGEIGFSQPVQTHGLPGARQAIFMGVGGEAVAGQLHRPTQAAQPEVAVTILRQGPKG